MKLQQLNTIDDSYMTDVPRKPKGRAGVESIRPSIYTKLTE